MSVFSQKEIPFEQEASLRILKYVWQSEVIVMFNSNYYYYQEGEARSLSDDNLGGRDKVS